MSPLCFPCSSKPRVRRGRGGASGGSFGVLLLGALLLALEVTSPAQETPAGEQAGAASAFDLPAETVVVYNPEFAKSRELADYYARLRGIPQERVVGLACPLDDSISRQEYDSLLRRPLFEKFVREGWWRLQASSAPVSATAGGGKPPVLAVAESSVRLVVLMRGIPFQIRRDQQNPQNTQEDEASVDSELCTLGLPARPAAGALRNPYFGQDMRFQMFQGAPGLLLTGRLDGPDADTVKRMIDDALEAEKNGLRGRAVIDLARKTGAYVEGEEWLARSAVLFRQAGIPVYVDREEALIPDYWPLPDTAFYFGWYSASPAGGVATPSFRFVPGAIACHLHSFSGSAIRSRDRHWVGPLLSQGAAAALGNAFEPYLSLTVHFDILNQRLLEGHTLAEAAWNATPVLSWMNLVCGDPLYRPYARGAGATLGEGRQRDYALYQGAARRHPLEDTRPLKKDLTTLAETRSKPHLLELTALLSASEGKYAEAVELLEHAESLYVIAADKARALLYMADFQRQDGHPEEARRLLGRLVENPAYKDVPAVIAARALLESL